MSGVAPQSDAKTRVVEAYVDGFSAGDPAMVAALFAEDATVEDPVGVDPIRGKEAIRAFYATAMGTGARLRLTSPIRTTGTTAAFAFSVDLRQGDLPMRIDVIDIFDFDAEGRISAMRAYWGPANVHTGSSADGGVT